MSVIPLAGLPERVQIYEVGPRDGLQNEAVVLDLATKFEFISRLASAGLSVIEVTSFVRKERVPQLADATELVAGLASPRSFRAPVLVPNLTGLDRAASAGVSEIAVFASATETFAQKNLNRSREESLVEFTKVVAKARSHTMWVRGYVSMCFGDPWEGDVPIEEVHAVVLRLFDMGCVEVSVGDTLGVATPGHVHALLAAVLDSGIEKSSIAVHFHDTYGQALSNTLAALEAGITTVDSSAGGLGGCPYAKSATGNLATEDLVFQLNGLGITTGVDLDALVATSTWLAGHLGRTSPSRTVQALAKELSDE